MKKIFFPKCCTRAPPGILIGCENPADDSVHVIATVQFPITAKALNAYIAKYNDHEEDSQKVRPIGVWLPLNCSSKDEENGRLLPRLFRQDSWISLSAVKNELGHGNVRFDVELFTQKETGGIFLGQDYSKVPLDSMVIIYNQKEMWDMEIFPQSTLASESPDNALGGLFQTISHCKQGILTYEAGMSCEEGGIKITHCCVEREASLVFHLLKIFVTLFFGGVFLVLRFIQRVYRSYCSKLSSLLTLASGWLQLSSFCGHALRRFADLFISILALFSQSENFGETKQRKHKDIIASFFMDVVFGMAMLYGMYHLKLFPEQTTKEVFLPYAEFIAGQVEELIKWLMGIPAGLKLNHPLNQFLGHFFLYHVRLWLEYARMMMDLFPHLMTHCLMMSCLGLSFFLSIISDTVSTLSFHIYCFYVYAGRLYGLQVTGLMSLWRLFRGKKWNPLRKRVDSLEESGQRADQLFLGTLLFTVLLFLLPTTALYYGIFTLLRVAVLLIQVVLSGLVFILSEFPWYTAVLRLFRPNKFASTVRCDWISAGDQYEVITREQTGTIEHRDDEALVLYMSLYPQSYIKSVWWGLRQRHQSPIVSNGPKALVKKILSGDLIRWT